MPTESTCSVRGPLGTAMSAGITAAAGANIFNKENLSSTQISHLFLAGALGGLIVGNMLPFFKKNTQEIGWDAIDMREIKLATNPILYAASNMSNRMTETVMIMASLALGFILLNYSNSGFITSPLMDLLWKDAAWANTLFTLVDTCLLLHNFEKHFDITIENSVKRFLTDCTPCCHPLEKGMRATQQRLLLDNGDDHVINTGIVPLVTFDSQA